MEEAHGACHLLHRRWGLTSYVVRATEMTPGLRERLPPTDSRLRADLQALERARYEEVGKRCRPLMHRASGTERRMRLGVERMCAIADAPAQHHPALDLMLQPQICQDESLRYRRPILPRRGWRGGMRRTSPR